MKLSETLSIANIIYVPPPQRLNLLIVLSVWLWDCILRFLDRYHIDVPHLIQLKSSGDIPSSQTANQLQSSTRRLATTLAKLFIPCHILTIIIFILFENQELSIIESLFFHSWPIIELSLLLRLILKSSPTMAHYTKRLLQIESTPRAVRNVYILIADSLVSLTSPLLDFIMFVLSASSKSPSSLKRLDLLLSFTPIFVRIFQCFREYTITPDSSMLFNVVKYSLGIPIQICTWYTKIRPNGDLPYNFHLLRIILLLLNSSYTLFWDIRMDWNITSFSHIRVSKLQFPKVMYQAAIVIDFVLRFWWMWITITMTLYSVNNFGMGRSFIFFPSEMQYFEIFRRALWVVFRLESELLVAPLGKQMA